MISFNGLKFCNSLKNVKLGFLQFFEKMQSEKPHNDPEGSLKSQCCKNNFNLKYSFCIRNIHHKSHKKSFESFHVLLRKSVS